MCTSSCFESQGRFSDAYSAAAEARGLEPFGRAVRLRCPRLMALHSKDAGYQASDTIGWTRASTYCRQQYILWPRLTLGTSLFSGRAAVFVSRKQHTMESSALKNGCCIKRPSCGILKLIFAVYVHHTTTPLFFSISQNRLAATTVVQYTRESLSAVRIQRAWREYHVVHALKELVEKQIAAMRIQRFMREWFRCNHSMAIQLVTAGAFELRYSTSI